LSLLHRHNNAEHLPIEESDESDYGEDEPLDDQEIDLGIGIHRIKKEEEVDLLTSDRPVLVYQRQLMDLATTHVNSNCTFKDCGEAISMSTEIIASAIYIKWVSMLYLLKFCFLFVFIPPLPKGGGRYTVLPRSVSPSVRQSKIFFGAFFSVTVDGRNLIFGHKRHICIPYCGERFWTRQIPTSCLPT
jgi:hypothetical protein